MKKKIWLQNNLYQWVEIDFEKLTETLATIGYAATIGNHATIGDDAKIGYRATIGDGAKIGYGIEIIKGIFIHGSRHSVTWTGNNTISIGCKNLTFDYWSKKFERIGKIENYSEDEIKEYELYIYLIIKLKS